MNNTVTSGRKSGGVDLMDQAEVGKLLPTGLCGRLEMQLQPAFRLEVGGIGGVGHVGG